LKNKKQQGWRRLTRIANDELEEIKLHFLRCGNRLQKLKIGDHKTFNVFANAKHYFSSSETSIEIFI